MLIKVFLIFIIHSALSFVIPKFGNKIKFSKQLFSTPKEMLDYSLSNIAGLNDPGSETYIANAGLLYLSLNDHEKALEMFEASVALNPQRDSSWFNLAQLLEAGLVKDTCDRDNDILHAYSMAIAATDSRSVASASYNNAFALLLSTGRGEEAAQWADRALQSLPDDHRAWFNAGIIMRETENLEWAVSCFTKAREYASDSGSVALALNNLGDAYSRQGQWTHAVQAFIGATEADPHDAESFYNAALVLRDHLNDYTKAEEYLKKCVAVKPDHSQAAFQLAALTKTEIESVKSLTAPPQYIVELFDHYAEAGYDSHMLNELQYRGHELVVQGALTARADLVDDDMVLVDLGCGTGLVGEALRARGVLGKLIGCDLSSLMIQTASKRLYERKKMGGINKVTSKVYERVDAADCEIFLRNLKKGSIDAILAGDVLCYYGDLTNIFNAVYEALGIGGLFSFTVELKDEEEIGKKDGFALQMSARFAHVNKAIVTASEKAGFIIWSRQDVQLRLQGGTPVRGGLYVVKK
jgi:predicted TPR repeat methyltransferase